VASVVRDEKQQNHRPYPEGLRVRGPEGSKHQDKDPMAESQEKRAI
jgi:hypothetical protein